MKKRNIELTIETAERWFNGCDRELKELALQTFPELEKKRLPKSWIELEDTSGCFITPDSLVYISNEKRPVSFNKNVFATKEQAEACIALAQLSQLREVYRNGWVPDWNDEKQWKYCIEFYQKNPDKANYLRKSKFLSFENEETRDLFLENFRDLIEKAKPLMQ
jgi:hypothetical protein